MGPCLHHMRFSKEKMQTIKMRHAASYVIYPKKILEQAGEPRIIILTTEEKKGTDPEQDTNHLGLTPSSLG